MVFFAGEKLTAAKMNSELNPLFAYKPGNQGITNSTTLQDDDHLFVPVAANTIYTVEASIGTLANTGVDGRFAWSRPSGSTVYWGAQGLSDQATDLVGIGDWEWTSSNVFFTFGGANIDVWIQVSGLIIVGGTSGTFRLQWAQRVADPALATWVLQGSWLRLRKVG